MTTIQFLDLVHRKTPLENLRQRLKVFEKARTDKVLRGVLIQACREDILFFFNLLAWCYEPRATVKVKPFVTWPHQVPAILALHDSLVESQKTELPIDVVIEKARGQGGTWICNWILVYWWLFNDYFSAGLVTRNEKLVDSKSNADALLWKFDWSIRMLPRWLLPAGYDYDKQHSYTNHTIANPQNNAVVTGCACTWDAGLGGRQTVFFHDEFSAVLDGTDWAMLDSTQHVTLCRWFVSAYYSDSNAFYALANERSSAKKIVLDWKDNPTQNDLLFVFREGIPFPMDPQDGPRLAEYVAKHKDELERLTRRGFLKDGRVVSPWYLSKCLQPGTTPRGIAQQLDRNARGAVGKVMDTDVLDKMAKEKCREPVWQGRVTYDPETLKMTGLIKQEVGVLKLWFTPGIDHSAPFGQYAIGADVAAGSSQTGSNSALSGMNMTSGEQVLEYAEPGILPTKFARLAVVICRWLYNATLNWETTGASGGTFGREVLEQIQYGSIFYRDVDEIGSKKKTRKAGWAARNDEVRAFMLESLCNSMSDGELVPRSADMIRECGEYEWEQGKIIHRPTKSAGDDQQSHADRVVSAGMMWLAAHDRKGFTGVDQNQNPRQDIPHGSMQWRHQERLAEAARTADPWGGPIMGDGNIDSW